MKFVFCIQYYRVYNWTNISGYIWQCLLLDNLSIILNKVGLNHFHFLNMTNTCTCNYLTIYTYCNALSTEIKRPNKYFTVYAWKHNFRSKQFLNIGYTVYIITITFIQIYCKCCTGVYTVYKHSVLHRQSRDRNQNMKWSVYCQYG